MDVSKEKKKESKMSVTIDDRVVTYYIAQRQSTRLTDEQCAIVTKAKKEHKRFQLISTLYSLDNSIAPDTGSIGVGAVDAILEYWFVRYVGAILNYAEDKNITVSIDKDTFRMVITGANGNKLQELYINVVD